MSVSAYSTSSISTSTCKSTSDTMPKYSHEEGRARHVNSLRILQKGYLSVRKKLFKPNVMKFYFLIHGCPRLFCFHTEQYFEHWIISNSYFTGSKDGDGVLEPMYVCTVIRGDRCANDRFSESQGFTVLEGQAANFKARKFLTPSRSVCDAWLDAIRQIQLQGQESGSSSNSTASMKVVDSNQVLSSRSHSSQPSTPHSSLEYEERSNNCRESQGSSKACNTDSLHEHPNEPDFGTRSKVSTTSSDNNVVLFQPGEISSLTISDAKLSVIKEDLQWYLNRGHQRPSRKGLDQKSIANTKWRYGPPDFLLYDLTFIKGRTRDDQDTPLESYIESCFHTFIMDAMHKCFYKDWISVHQHNFYIQVNDGEKICGQDIGERDMFGLLYLSGSNKAITNQQTRSPQSLLFAAFTQGFPLEILEVYSQPPRCHFAWRQWGPFSGRYNLVKGDDRILEIRGFGYVEIDNHRMKFLSLYYKLENLFKALDEAAEVLGLGT